MIQLNYLLIFQFIALLVVVYGKMDYVLDGNFETCSDGRNMDPKQMEFNPYNDTHVFLNGKYVITFVMFKKF